MKVKITNEAKKWLTVAELPEAKQIISDMKEYDESAAEALKTAANCWIRNAEQANKIDDVIEVLSASAEIAGNNRIFDQYGEGTGRLDVWITGTIETFYGFIKMGCYLSDIWNIGPEDFNRDFPGYCYGRYFTEKK